MKALALKYSKGEVDRAADTWREFMKVENIADADPELMDRAGRALSVIDHYRACHAYPLQKATVGLRSSVSRECDTVQVTQRHKRFVTILDKLTREPNMKLSRMQDIGGCRAVLPDIPTVRAVQRRLEKRVGFVRMADYIAKPRESGYRGVHVILQYDGRMIECQLRTQRMHEWAITVEQIGGRVNSDLKSGVGPVELLDFFKLVSAIDHAVEMGTPVTDELTSAATTARDGAVQLLADWRPSQ